MILEFTQYTPTLIRLTLRLKLIKKIKLNKYRFLLTLQNLNNKFGGMKL